MTNSDQSTPMMDLYPDDPVFESLDMKPFRNAAIRQAEQFLPGESDPQTRAILCPWGETLDAHYGDYIVSEQGHPEDCWPVTREIFEKTYVRVGEDLYRKKALTCLVPMQDLSGDPDRMVRVHTREGVVTVRSGDFHLAKGVEGEIWPFPSEKIHEILVPADDSEDEE